MPCPSGLLSGQAVSRTSSLQHCHPPAVPLPPGTAFPAGHGRGEMIFQHENHLSVQLSSGLAIFFVPACVSCSHGFRTSPDPLSLLRQLSSDKGSGEVRKPWEQLSLALSLWWPWPPTRSKAPASFHLGFSKIYRSLAFHGRLHVADLMDTFPQPSTLPLVPFALQMALASFLPVQATLPSSKQTQGPQLCSCTGPVPPSTRAAGKRPRMSRCAQGCSPGPPPPQGHGPLYGWGHLRSRGDDDTAHPVEAAVPQVQALSGELHLPALEVLLVEDDDLGTEGKGRAGTGMLREGRAVLHVPAGTLHS